MKLTDREALKREGYVPVDRFGKDHWSLLGYIGTCVVDGQELDPRLMRRQGNQFWKPEYGSRLKGYFKDKSNKSLLLTDHDDWSCLHDLEAEGLIVRPSAVSLVVGLTPKGQAFEAALREHKQADGNFAQFGNTDRYEAVAAQWRVKEA